MEKLLLSPILVRVLDSGEIYHFCCLKVTHGFIDGVEWRLFRGANTSLCLMIEHKRATLPLTPVQKDDSAMDAQYASRPFSFSPASLHSDSCTAITTAMIRFPLVSSSSAVLTATCRDLKALKDGSCGNIVWWVLGAASFSWILAVSVLDYQPSARVQLQQRLY